MCINVKHFTQTLHFWLNAHKKRKQNLECLGRVKNKKQVNQRIGGGGGGGGGGRQVCSLTHTRATRSTKQREAFLNHLYFRLFKNCNRDSRALRFPLFCLFLSITCSCFCLPNFTTLSLWAPGWARKGLAGPGFVDVFPALPAAVCAWREGLAGPGFVDVFPALPAAVCAWREGLAGPGFVDVFPALPAAACAWREGLAGPGFVDVFPALPAAACAWREGLAGPGFMDVFPAVPAAACAWREGPAGKVEDGVEDAMTLKVPLLSLCTSLSAGELFTNL